MARRRSLPDEVSIYTAASLHEQCLGWARRARRSPLEVDAAGVCEVDAAGLQLLVAFRRSLEARGIELEIQRPAHCLCAAAATLGLSQALGLAADGNDAGASR